MFESLARKLAGKKPFRNFTDQLIYLGLDEQWYAYEATYAREVMAQWLEEKKEQGKIKDIE